MRTVKFEVWPQPNYMKLYLEKLINNSLKEMGDLSPSNRKLIKLLKKQHNIIAAYINYSDCVFTKSGEFIPKAELKESGFKFKIEYGDSNDPMIWVFN